MSIYPVRLAEWYPPGDESHEFMRTMVDHIPCLVCRKPAKWWRAIGHHSLPWGFGDVWCSEKCFRKGGG